MPSVETDTGRSFLEHSATAPILAAGLLLKHWVRNVWQGVREWCGDSAYERYLHARRGKSNDAPALTPAEFYVEQLNRRYSRPNRCC